MSNNDTNLGRRMREGEERRGGGGCRGIETIRWGRGGRWCQNGAHCQHTYTYTYTDVPSFRTQHSDAIMRTAKEQVQNAHVILPMLQWCVPHLFSACALKQQ